MSLISVYLKLLLVIEQCCKQAQVIGVRIICVFLVDGIIVILHYNTHLHVYALVGLLYIVHGRVNII